jgi:hypothetical protein
MEYSFIGKIANVPNPTDGLVKLFWKLPIMHKSKSTAQMVKAGAY